MDGRIKTNLQSLLEDGFNSSYILTACKKKAEREGVGGSEYGGKDSMQGLCPFI